MKLSHAIRFSAFAFLLSVMPAVFSSPSAAQVGIGISVRFAPPALPVYEQPICPNDGYLWTPGYWSWDDDGGYYWVPGTWVEPPQPGMLWTPGYWGWNDGVYAFNEGYWGPTIGFYGGINYGFGYGGNGFEGGEWREGHFFYNRSVTNVNVTNVTNVYNKTVIVNNTHVAFNGGQGGVQARPTAEQERYAHETHTPPVEAQRTQAHAASQNKALFASNNHGRPAIAATARPGEFSGKGAVPAKAAGAAYRAPTMSPKEARATPGEKAAPAGHAETNRPAANHPGATHPAEGRPATANRSDRPASASHPASTSHASSAHPAEHSAAPTTEHPTEHASESRSTKPAATEHKTAPSHASNTRPESARPEAKPRTESAPKESASKPEPKPREAAPAREPKPAASHASTPKPAPKSQPHPAASKPAPAPKPAPKAESAPRPAPKPAPAAHAAAPKPAPAQHQAPPSKQEPKPEHKGQ